MAEERSADVIAFPRMPRPFIASLVGQCPALGAVADLLERVPEGRRFDCECALGELFARVLYFPKLTRTEAYAALAHEDPGSLADEELALLAADPERAPINEIWTWVWEREEVPEVREWTRHAVASLARLYRLEYRYLNLRYAV